jgi:hypothetical protein
MRPSEVFEKNRELIRNAVVRFRTTNPRIFGSVLHGTDGEDSDIDLVVDTLPGATLFDLIGLEQELEKSLGVPVQVVISDGLHSFIRDKVLAEARPV